MNSKMFKFKETDEVIIGNSGLSLINSLINKTNLKSRFNKLQLESCVFPAIPHSANIISYLALLSLGNTDFESIDEYREDEFFKFGLNINIVPSSSTLRQRFDMIGNSSNFIIKEEVINLLKNTNVHLSSCFPDYIPLDIDVSSFDNSFTKKEGVTSVKYKNFFGFSPIFAYLGQNEGYLINLELREGKQHCQNNTENFLRESIKNAKQITGEKVLVRMDSGNDSIDNIKVCLGETVDWIIKRNLRKESKDDWLEKAKKYGRLIEHSAKQDVYKGKMYVARDGIKEKIRIVFEITEKFIDDKNQHLLVSEKIVDTYWTSLENDVDDIIELYHKHATSEQFHSEIKTDMDLERLPSGKFKTNELVLLLGMFAYNCLRICGQTMLENRDKNKTRKNNIPIRKKIKRRRIRKVIHDLMFIASKFIKTGRYYILSFYNKSVWKNVLWELYAKFNDMNLSMIKFNYS